MPILIVAAVVAVAWYALWKGSQSASDQPRTVQRLGRRLGSATRAASDAWRGNADRRLSLLDARALLGVSETATAAEIEAAYRRLMLRAHPDQGGTDALAAKLTAARERLIKKS
ncbi:MAG TPA: DnaJ domain-containing protein [Caulobacteraceae bacterium]|jgi:DnaJ-domain-containing protein 1